MPTCTARTYRRQLAISLQESKNRQVQGSAELECRYIVGSFPRDLQLLESPTHLIPAKMLHKKTCWKLKQQISVLKKNWGERDAVRITTIVCVHTELYLALSLKFMDIKMLQTTNLLNLKELKIMGFTVFDCCLTC